MTKMPISFKKAAGVTSIKHNNRDFTEKDWENDYHKHIDRGRVADNVVIKQEHIRDAYERIFGEALQKYNDKQRRKDRKIDDYYDHVKNSKTLHTQYEFIVQVGKKEDFENNSENWEIANGILLDYVDEFQKRNSNFEVYNAVVHNDEASPHLHLNVIPVAEGYKRGLERQPAFNKALENQGIVSGKDSRTIFRNFRDQEIKGIEHSLNEKGIERLKVGTNNIKNHHEYKELRTELEELSQITENKRSELEKIEDRVNALENTEKALEAKIEPFKEDLERIKTIERDKMIEENELENIKGRRRALRATEKEEEEAYKEKMKRYKKREEEAKRLAVEAESRLRKIERAVEEKLDDFSIRLDTGIATLKEHANDIYQGFYSSAEDTLSLAKSWFERNGFDFEKAMDNEIERQIDDVEEPNLDDIDYFYGYDDEPEL